MDVSSEAVFAFAEVGVRQGCQRCAQRWLTLLAVHRESSLQGTGTLKISGGKLKTIAGWGTQRGSPLETVLIT